MFVKKYLDCNGDEDKFKCRKGGCILKERVCDGFANCEG